MKHRTYYYALILGAIAVFAIPQAARAATVPFCVRHSGNDASSGQGIFCGLGEPAFATINRLSLPGAGSPAFVEGDAPYTEQVGGIPNWLSAVVQPNHASDRIRATGQWYLGGGTYEKVDFASCPIIRRVSSEEISGEGEQVQYPHDESQPWEGPERPVWVEMRTEWAHVTFLGDTFPAGCVGHLEYEQSHEYPHTCVLRWLELWGPNGAYGRKLNGETYGVKEHEKGIEPYSGCGKGFYPQPEWKDGLSFTIGPARY